MVSGVNETVRYTYRLRPGRTAENALLAEWGRCRWLWNEAVHQRKTGRDHRGELPAEHRHVLGADAADQSLEPG